jgi:hypothetical protein
MKLTLKDLITIIPTIGIVFMAGVATQYKFIGADMIHDAVETCSADLKEAIGELRLAERYITYLEADSQFNKSQTMQNFQASNDKKMQLQKQLLTYPKKTKKKTLIDKFSQLKQMQTDSAAVIPADIGIDMRVK